MTMMNRRSLIAWAATAMLLAPTVIASAPAPAQAETKFILANVVNPEHIQYVTAEAFIAKLKELTGDGVTVEYHPGGDLGDWVQQFDQTMQGSIQMTQTWNASEFDSRLDIATLGYTVDDWAGGEAAYKPGQPMAQFWDEVFADLNMKVIGILPDGFYGVAVRKGVDAPTKFPDDAKGFKLRVPPIKIGITRFEALGFSAVAMPYSEVYTSLQLGTIDGAAFQDATSVAGYADVYDHYVRTNDIFGYSFWLAHKPWYDGLSEADRKAIDEAALYAVNHAWDAFVEIDNAAIERMKAAGMQVHLLTADELAAAKDIVYEVEWPWMEGQVGKETMDAVRQAVGVN